MASIDKQKDSVSVRWREGGSNRRRTFTRSAHGTITEAHRAAKKLKSEIERRKESGDLGYYRGLNMSLTDLVNDEWWTRYAELELETKTLELYSWLWNKHILPYLGEYEMREIRAGTIRDWRIEMQKRGTGEPTVRKAMSLLQGIFRWAAEDELIPPANPVQVVKKPSAPRRTKIQVFSPEDIERLRNEFDSVGDRTLVSVLAYSGLRPEEALALTWGHMRRNTLHVERKLVDGRIIETTKTGKSRTVEMMEQLRADLLAWRKALFVPEDSNTLIFPKAGTSNDPWKRADYENWRARKFRPAMKRIELQGRIYDLRHSYASLLIAGGYRPPYVAEQLGHTVTTSMDTYQHVFQEASDPHAWLDPDARITEARKKFGDA